jgi:hypothetical protein
MHGKSMRCYHFLIRDNVVCRWETGYWGTMDIAHDRAGYYLCWGCLNWVPAIYTSPALYLTEHPVEWSLPAAIAVAVAGTLAIYINYDSDRQRQVRLQHRHVSIPTKLVLVLLQ